MAAYTVLLLMIVLLLNQKLIEARPKIVRMDASCLGKNYCMKKPDGYPQEQFEKIMRDFNIPEVGRDRSVYSNGVVNQMDYICKGKIYFQPIYQIVDQAGDVRYVAQIPHKYMQKYVVVECARPGRVMGPYGGNVFELDQLENFNVTSVETRLDHKFLVLSHDGERVEFTRALHGIPAACSCRYSYLE